MADITLNREERKQLIVGLVRNCNGWDQDDIELLANMSDGKLFTHAEGCAELIDNAETEDTGVPGSMKPSGAGAQKGAAKKADDEQQVTGDAGEGGVSKTHPDMEKDQPTMKKGEGATQNMTTEQYLANMPDPIRDVVINALEFDAAQKDELVHRITANARNQFSEDFLRAKPTEELRVLADMVAPERVSRSPMFVGAAGGPVVNTQSVDRDEILVPPTMDFSRN